MYILVPGSNLFMSRNIFSSSQMIGCTCSIDTTQLIFSTIPRIKNASIPEIWIAHLHPNWKDNLNNMTIEWEYCANNLWYVRKLCWVLSVCQTINSQVCRKLYTCFAISGHKEVTLMSNLRQKDNIRDQIPWVVHWSTEMKSTNNTHWRLTRVNASLISIKESLSTIM